MSNGGFILLGVIVVIYFLGKYAIIEGRRLEEKKKFMKNMESFGKNKNKNKN